MRSWPWCLDVIQTLHQKCGQLKKSRSRSRRSEAQSTNGSLWRDVGSASTPFVEKGTEVKCFRLLQDQLVHERLLRSTRRGECCRAPSGRCPASRWAHRLCQENSSTSPTVWSCKHHLMMFQELATIGPREHVAALRLMSVNNGAARRDTTKPRNAP